MTTEPLAVLEFSVPSPPVPKGRPRFGQGRTFTPERTRAYELLVKLYARAAVAKHPAWPRDASYILRVALYRESLLVRIEAFPASKRSMRGDVDNYAKLASDAINGIAWDDDRQVRTLHVTDTGE